MFDNYYNIGGNVIGFNNFKELPNNWMHNGYFVLVSTSDDARCTTVRYKNGDVAMHRVKSIYDLELITIYPKGFFNSTKEKTKLVIDCNTNKIDECLKFNAKPYGYSIKQEAETIIKLLSDLPEIYIEEIKILSKFL